MAFDHRKSRRRENIVGDAIYRTRTRRCYTSYTSLQKQEDCTSSYFWKRNNAFVFLNNFHEILSLLEFESSFLNDVWMKESLR